MKYEVRKDVRFTWTLDAENQEEALAAVADLEPSTLQVLRERARDLDRATRKPAKGAITDRELRPGRKFMAKYRGQTYEAIVQGDLTIMVPGVGDGYKSLSTAGHKVTGRATNGWVFWKEPPAEGTVPEEPTPKPKKARKAPARPPTPPPAEPSAPPEAEPEPAQE